MSDRATGSVNWFSVGRGFGWISRDDGGRRCFFRHAAIQGTTYGLLGRGSRVEFDVMQGSHGPTAGNVVRLG